MKHLILLSVFCLPCFAGKITSFYSSTEQKHVAVISSSEREKDPEIDHFEHLCPGYGGYELLHRGGDIRSHLDIRYQGKTSDLYAATMNAGRGHFVHKANDTVEWRGILEGNVFTPFALIYRVSAQDPENEQKSRATLIVIALHKGEARILGTASGNNEDTDAKKLADQAAPKRE